MMYFKIISGFSDPNPIVIDETELQTAIHAQVSGRVFVAKRGATIAGNSISKIIPDFDQVEKKYNPHGEDIVPRRVEEAHYLAIENSGEVVRAKIENRTPRLKEPSVKIHTKGFESVGQLMKK